MFKVLEEFPLQRKHFIAEAGKRLDNMNKSALDDEDDDRILVSNRRQTKMQSGKMSSTAKKVATVAKLSFGNQ